MPLCGSPNPIGYIYGATPDPDGGLLAMALAFFPHQGHQVVYDPCLDLEVYCRNLCVMATIILVNCRPGHILSTGLKLMEGLFAPSLVDVLGMSFTLAYLSPPTPGAPTALGGLPDLPPAASL